MSKAIDELEAMKTKYVTLNEKYKEYFYFLNR